MPSSRRAQLLVVFAAGVGLGLGACSSGDAPATTGTTATASRTAAARTPAAAPPLCGRLHVVVTGRLAAPEATEISGLVASPTQPGVLWAHNDSGDRARIFALRSDGSLIASLDVPGAEATDWEDIAVGPDGDLLLGDIGDNTSVRKDIDIYRVPEPWLADGPSTTTAAATRLRLTYPDGAHDAETLLADPHTGEIVIVTKRLDGRSGVYGGQAPARDVPREAVLRHAGDLRLGLGGLATAGDVSADGRTVAIRTYTALYVWARKPGASLATTLARKPCVASAQLGLEGQGESLALSHDGRSFFTIPEGAGARVRRYTAKKAAR
jgi:F0F1-type ATP synthase membrane subunit c/vacuolar-type H+-ATPase subunit K